MIILSEYLTTSLRLWEIRRVVIFSVSIRLLVLSMILRLVLGSRAAVCSSRRRSFGLLAVAISRDRDCLCPPDKRPVFVWILFSRLRLRVLCLLSITFS